MTCLMTLPFGHRRQIIRPKNTQTVELEGHTGYDYNGGEDFSFDDLQTKHSYITCHSTYYQLTASMNLDFVVKLPPRKYIALLSSI